MPEGSLMDEIMPEPFYLPEDEKERSRGLYKEAFPEDTEKFVDFYYTCKTRDNQILALEQDGELVSMVHLNPYTMIVNGFETPVNYIVAVATGKEYRHRGYMRLLLVRALQDMAARNMPFTFLMPASERIYAPFDFVWICPYTELSPRVERMDAAGQNRYLAARYQMFCKRDAVYLENLAAEKRAEEGEMPPGKMPPYMARITDVSQMLRMVNTRQAQKLYLKIRDPIIQKNDGWFCWEAAPDFSRAEKLTQTPERTDLELTVGELASTVFGEFRICLSEIV